MNAARSPRWLMSFADLTLLLLGFFVLLHARADGRATAAGVRAAFGGPVAPGEAPVDLAAARLFEPGEAVLRPGAARLLGRLGHRYALHHGRVRVASRGSDLASARFDAWELSAARAAAVARAIGGGGLASDAIDIALPQARQRGAGAQVLTVGPA